MNREAIFEKMKNKKEVVFVETLGEEIQIEKMPFGEYLQHAENLKKDPAKTLALIVIKHSFDMDGVPLFKMGDLDALKDDTSFIVSEIAGLIYNATEQPLKAIDQAKKN